MSDLKELARELAEAASVEMKKRMRGYGSIPMEVIFEPILSKHFPPAEPKPAVSMEDVVERIVCEVFTLDAFEPEHTEYLRTRATPIIRAELAEVEEVLKECWRELDVARAIIDTQHQCQTTKGTEVWRHEHDLLQNWSALITRITKLTGGTNGDG